MPKVEIERAFQMVSEIAPKSRSGDHRSHDSSLEEAVRSELVSEGYFPASWENTGKFVDSGLSHPNFQSKALVDQRLTVRIPCEMEQGNNCALAGK